MDTWEYKELSTEKQDRINREINYMSMALHIMTQLFAVKGGTERSVVAWQDMEDEPYTRVFRFSCIAVAAMALGCNKSKISAVCQGKREHTGGQWILNQETGRKEYRNAWKFMYEEDYDEDQDLNFDANSNEFKFN